jgi:uncharacterized protein
MEIAGYIASVLIGVSLGLIGGGGSVLTLPVLVYLFGINTITATTYSLFVVGASSLVGSISYFKKGLIKVTTATSFGIPSIIAVLLTRHYLLPAIPEQLINVGSFILTKSILLMLLFAVLMVFAAYSMIRKETEEQPANQQPANKVWVMVQGFIVGIITGLIGAGGGFLIIPALVNLLKLPIKTAIGTSLIIIALNSLTGFGLSLGKNHINWSFLLTVTLIAIIGIFIGSYFSTKIDGKRLKPAFGWFVLVMGIYILLKETLLK